MNKRLIDMPPRERSGARSANRFDFQRDWTLCRILELHESSNDYAVVCDYHDDVLILDSPEPTAVHFYQIKTRTSGAWTINRLSSPAKGKEGPLNSVLGKLYRHRLDFGELAASLRFVSNATFDVTLESGASSATLVEIGIHELAANARSELGERIRTEHSLTEPADFGDFTILQVSQLSGKDHAAHARGRLADFLEKVSGGDGAPSVGAAYRTLFDEIKARSAHEDPITSMRDLLRLKSITRTMFANLLNTIGVRDRLSNAWPRVEQHLLAEQMVFTQIAALRNSWTRYIAERTDETNGELQTLADQVAAAIKTLLGSGKQYTLTELLNDTALVVAPTDVYGSAYIGAMTLVELAEHGPLSPIQEANPQSPEPPT